jgi:mortality factor 4-like protein 1
MYAFVKKERVLCFHGPQLYEANVLDSQKRAMTAETEGGDWYKVHYKGWKVT